MKSGQSRYSAVSFINGDNILCMGVLVGAVHVTSNTAGNESNIILHIAVMEKSTEKEVPVFWPFERYKYLYNVSLEIVCVTVDKLVDHIFMYPDYSPEFMSSLGNTQLHTLERYWYIPRCFFDRRKVEEAEDFCDLSYGINEVSAREYIRSNQANSRTDGLVLATIQEHNTNFNAFHQEELHA